MLAVAAAPVTASAQVQPARLAASSLTSAGTTIKETSQSLPPLPAGVSELKFSDFCVSPVGERGLQLTDKLLKLDGKRVRILGYMAKQETPKPGPFLLAAIPTQVHDDDHALADDLPPATLYVSMPSLSSGPVRYTPGLLLLTGTLSVGNREEADGRISIARLAVDPPEPVATKRGSPRKGASATGKVPRPVNRTSHR